MEQKVLKYFTNEDCNLIREQQEIILQRIESLKNGCSSMHEARIDIWQALLKTLYQGRHK